MNIKELEDRTSLKELIDSISILADKRDFSNQVQLFSENAVSETIAEGTTLLKLEGRKEMAEAFDQFLNDYKTVYHFNGQQVVAIDGDHAKGTCYCLITLISDEKGKVMKTTIGAIYDDDYVRVNNSWLITKRIGNFNWQEKVEVNQ